MLDEIWRGDDKLLGTRMHLIKAPTHIVWGGFDGLSHVSGIDLLKERLPNCFRIDILENAGHSLYMDAPKQFATILQQFIAAPA